MPTASRLPRMHKVNRKERRSAKSRIPAGGTSADQLFAQADRFHREGRLDDAERLYRQALDQRPRHAGTLHRLGFVAHQLGRNAAAARLLRQAISLDGAQGVWHSHLALALCTLGQRQEALEACRRALVLDETLVDAHCNLSVIAMQLGRWEEAVAAAGRAVALAPGLADAHNNLGNALMGLGQFGQARRSFERALDLAPAFAEAHGNLGNALWRLGQAQDAAVQYEAALRLNPGLSWARGSLGEYFLVLGRPDAAAAQFEAALVAAPQDAALLCGLAQARLAMGDGFGALAVIAGVLDQGDAPDARRVFVDCARALDGNHPALRPLLLRALAEHWCRPEDIAPVCARLVLTQPDIASLTAQDANTPRRRFGAKEALVLAGDPLLINQLCAAPNVDPTLEHVLTETRRWLLQAVCKGAQGPGYGLLQLQAALARQCFLNEYVFFCRDDEAEQAETARRVLSTALARDAAVVPELLLVVASYGALYRVPHAARLLDRDWDPAVQAVLMQQIREPDEECALRATIACPVPVRDPVSCAVQAQYEDNPYPRWAGLARIAGPSGAGAGCLVDHLRSIFPFTPIGDAPPLADILVAGCGTGRHALETAQQFAPARVLAIDLSLSSLAYAKRKSPGGEGIEYLQMDILDVPSIGRTFDLIEAVGVLHHLSDPLAGWHALLSCLKPGGFMKLGLYSRLARRKLEGARTLIAGSIPAAAVGRLDAIGPDTIRQARHLLIERNDASLDILERPDFYTVSNCRDLLFHVNEHCLTLDAIAGFLKSQDLTFLGFVLDAPVLSAYRLRFTGDPAAVDLGNWQQLENENPDIFSSMYEFWVRKA